MLLTMSWEEVQEDANIDRKIKMYSISQYDINDKKMKNIQRVFDLSKFKVEMLDNKDARKSETGLNDNVQEVIMEHDKFFAIIKKIVSEVESKDYDTIAVMCSHGILYAPAIVEMLKYNVYSKGIVNHVKLNKLSRE